MNMNNTVLVIAVALMLNVSIAYRVMAQKIPGIIPAQYKNTANQQDAIRIYNAIIAKKDGSIDAHIALATIYRKNGQAKDAVAVMKDAQSRKPDNEKVLAHLGYALIAAKEPQKAVHIFDMLTAINHKSIEGYNGKAVAFDHAGNHTAAQEIYEQALRLSPNSPTVQNNLAVSMIMNNNPDGAIAILKPLSKQSNAPKTVDYNLALAYGIKGDGKMAMAINMKHMTAKQAKENQIFYDHYAYLLESQKLEVLTPKMQKEIEGEDGIFVDSSAITQKNDTSDFKPTKITPPADNNKKETSFWGSDVKAEYPH